MTRLLQGDLAISPSPRVFPVILRNLNVNLVFWAFNVGNGNMESSDLVRRMNGGEDVVAVANDELPLWNKANGMVVNGVVRREAGFFFLMRLVTWVLCLFLVKG